MFGSVLSAAERTERRAELQAYVDRHQVTPLLHGLVGELLAEMPDNVPAFIVGYMEAHFPDSVPRQPGPAEEKEDNGGELPTSSASESESETDSDEDDDDDYIDELPAPQPTARSRMRRGVVFSEVVHQSGVCARAPRPSPLSFARAPAGSRLRSGAGPRRFGPRAREGGAGAESVGGLHWENQVGARCPMGGPAHRERAPTDARATGVGRQAPFASRARATAHVRPRHVPGVLLARRAHHPPGGRRRQSLYRGRGGVQCVDPKGRRGAGQGPVRCRATRARAHDARRVPQVASYEPGGCFGELALLHNAPRAASVVADTAVKAWAVNRVSFKRIMMSSSLKQQEEYLSFVRRISILGLPPPWPPPPRAYPDPTSSHLVPFGADALTDEERLRVVSSFTLEHYTAGDIVIRQGGTGDSFFIVRTVRPLPPRSGTLLLTHSPHIPGTAGVQGEVECSKEVTSRRGSRPGSRPRIRHEVVGTLHPGDYFGEVRAQAHSNHHEHRGCGR